MVPDQDITRGVQTLLRDPPNNTPTVQPPQQPPQAPPESNFNDHFALYNHQQQQQQREVQQWLYFQQQQQNYAYQQQQQQVNAHFALQFGTRQHGVPPQQQGHVTSTPQQQQQHVRRVVKKNVANIGKAAKESTPSGTKKRAGSGGLNKVCGVSPELQVIVGEASMARTEIVRQLWAYIRKNNLQDPSNKRKIICDEALRVVFETDSTDMFKMNKLLAKHILRLDPSKDSVPSKRQRLDVESGSLPTEAAETAKAAETVVAVESTGAAETSVVASPVGISDAFAEFLGTTRREMLASEAIQHVHEYVKVNGLEDPSSMTLTCDAKLRALLGCERISVLEIDETLARHHLLQSL